MKRSCLLTTGFLVLLTVTSFAQNRIVIDLHKLVKTKGLEVYNRDLSLVNETNYQGIRLSKQYGEGIAWLKGIEFSTGTLEFDVRVRISSNIALLASPFMG